MKNNNLSPRIRLQNVPVEYRYLVANVRSLRIKLDQRSASLVTHLGGTVSSGNGTVSDCPMRAFSTVMGAVSSLSKVDDGVSLGELESIVRIAESSPAYILAAGEVLPLLDEVAQLEAEEQAIKAAHAKASQALKDVQDQLEREALEAAKLKAAKAPEVLAAKNSLEAALARLSTIEVI